MSDIEKVAIVGTELKGPRGHIVSTRWIGDDLICLVEWDGKATSTEHNVLELRVVERMLSDGTWVRSSFSSYEQQRRESACSKE